MTGTHVVEECPELDQWRPQRAVWKDWREALGGRATSKNKKEEEEEGDLLGAFFYRVYEFLYTHTNPPPVIHRPHLPERYAIRFVPATGVPTPDVPVNVPVFVPASTPYADSVSEFSVVSSVNFVFPSASSSSEFSIASPANFVIPTRCAIDSVPAASVIPVISSPISYVNAPGSTGVPSSAVPPVFPSSSPSVFSVVSSANFVPASVFTSSSCIGTTQ